MKLFLILLLSPIFIFASDPDYNLYLKSGTFQPDEGTRDFSDPGDLIAGRYYRVVQFYQLPDQAERKAMEAEGVKLLEYLPKFAYLVSLPEGKKAEEVLNVSNVRAFFKMPLEFKLHPNISSGDFPPYMVTSSGKIRIQVLCFEESSLQIVHSLLAALGKVKASDHNPKVLEVETVHSNILQIAYIPGVQWIEPIDPAAEPENLPGRTNHRSNAIATEFANGRHYDGTGVIVAMGDDGVIGPHIDYEGRVDQTNVSGNSGDHGDHVAGTIMGAGNLNPTTRGMAFGADLHVYNVWNAINSTPNSYVSPGVRITSTSYSNGCNAGYTTFAQTADEHIYDMPSLMHVFSAGNNGTSNCNYGAGAGWGNITGGVKIGKNVIAVANITNYDALANSSSRGPAHDGRIKPDVSAVGTSVNSTVDVNSYSVKTGTSMSCPGTSGTLAQLYQAFKDHNGGVDPNSGLIKSILMNTADDLGNPGPDFKYGYGRINGLRAAKVIESASFLEDSLLTGSSNTHSISVPANVKELKVMIYWTDYKGSVNATRALVNDLDMVVTDPSSTQWNPWVLDPTPTVTALNSNATRSVDTLNNAEQVTIQNPAAGTYTVTVNGTMVPQGPQSYFVNWEFITDTITVTYPIGGESFVPGTSEILRWDAYGSTGSFSLEYSLDNGSSWNTISSSLSGFSRSYNWVVPTAYTGQALIRLSKGSLVDMSDASFSIMPVPSGLTVNWACPDSINLSWNSVSQATLYEVSMLGNKYMDSIAVTPNTSITLPNINQANDYWFSVKARGPLGAIGRRANAINKSPGTFACPVPYDAALTSLISPGSVIQECLSSSVVPVSIVIKNNGMNPISNVPVGYSLNGAATIYDTVAGPISPGNSVTFSFPTNVSLSPGSNTLMSFAIYPGDGNFVNDTIVSSIYLGTGNPVSPGWSNDFESFSLCSTAGDCEQTNCNLGGGFINVTNGEGDDIDWRTDNGGTPSGDTGPTFDMSPGTTSGKYIYLEASSGCVGKDAYLITPCLDLTTAIYPELSFGYHMYGATMGQLNVDIFDSVWILNAAPWVFGNQGDVWKTMQINLTAYAGKTIGVRVRGTTGGNYASDMALDNFMLKENYHVGVSQVTGTDSGMLVFPNPADGESVNVSFGKNSFSGKIRILDVTGRVMLEESANASPSENVVLDLSGLSSGVYWIQANGVNGAQMTNTFIKR